jgi:ABC-2 type transport system ATP-binding protein
MTDAVVAEDLVKTYGAVRALDGLSLRVPTGSILAVLGPNGAGKTTAVRIITTLLQPDSGRVEVAGMDVSRQADDVRKVIGLSGQYAAVDEYLTGRENLEMIARLYHLPASTIRPRAQELLDQFSLTDAANRTAKTYSGGMRRRLDLACALVARPQVLVLDEPTTGLDPRSRTDMWQTIRDLVAGGASLLLTTQYLEEADQLADRIVVVDKGKIIEEGTADELKSRSGGERLELVVNEAAHLDRARAILAEIGLDAPVVDQHTRRLSVGVESGTGTLVDAIRRLDAESIPISDIGVRRPTLDDVFLSLTGHAADNADEPPPTAGKRAKQPKREKEAVK